MKVRSESLRFLGARGAVLCIFIPDDVRLGKLQQKAMGGERNDLG